MSDVENYTRRVCLALRFGWTFSEASGRVHQKNLEWQRGPNRTSRLFLSHPHPTTGQSLWATLQQLLLLWEQLYPVDDKTPRVCPPPSALSEQIAAMEQWIGGYAKADLDTQETFTHLDEWSRRCWIQLGAEDALLQSAASLGASLGDTYWAMRVTQGGQAPVRKESWRYLLGAERTYHLIENVREVEPYLPENTGSLLRHSLWEWGIAEDLGRKPDGSLCYVNPKDWARLKKRHSNAINELSPEEEKNIYDHLDQQRRLWDDLLDDRAFALRPKDLRTVRWLAGVVFVALAVLLGSLTVIGVTGVLALVYRVAIWLFPLIARPTESKDWLAIGGALVSVLSFCGPLLWQWSRWVFGLYERIEHWARLAKLKQRTLCRWDGKEKHFLRIAWQQLRYPDVR